MGWGGRYGVPRATCPRPWTQLPRASAEGEGALSGAARAADKGSDRSPRPSPSPSLSLPATSAVTAYLSTAGPRGPRRARPSLCPPPPRRDPWAPAPDARRFGPGAAGVLRGSAVSPARVGERVRGAQQQRRARRGPPRSALARPPRRAPPACPALPLSPPPRAEPRPRPPHPREPADAEAGAGPRLRSSPPTPRGVAWWHPANPRGDVRLI